MQIINKITSEISIMYLEIEQLSFLLWGGGQGAHDVETMNDSTLTALVPW